MDPDVEEGPEPRPAFPAGGSQGPRMQAARTGAPIPAGASCSGPSGGRPELTEHERGRAPETRSLATGASSRGAISAAGRTEGLVGLIRLRGAEQEATAEPWTDSEAAREGAGTSGLGPAPGFQEQLSHRESGDSGRRCASPSSASYRPGRGAGRSRAPSPRGARARAANATAAGRRGRQCRREPG
eukprot:15310160-Alexandrium_andersonii.AAC.1